MQQIECPNCKHEFYAKIYKQGHCPKCGKTFIWDSACTGTLDEYDFPDWKPEFLPEFEKVL